MEAIFHRELNINRTLLRTFAVIAFVILIALGAYVRIPLPFTPVPLTLQTFFVLLSAAVLGAGAGVLTQLVYISLGTLGLSMFTGAGSGLLYLCGPSAGYLFGFIVAAYFAGTLCANARSNFKALFIVLAAADLVILLCGTIWLKFLLDISFFKSLSIGLLPFIPGDLLKALVVCAISTRVKKI